MAPARILDWWALLKSLVLVWVLSILLYYYAFHMSLQNSSVDNASPSSFSSTSDHPISGMEQRLRLYDKMQRDLDEHGAIFLKRGETSQSLSLSDIFTLKDGEVAPKLKAAIPPVRANILYMSTDYSIPISDSIKNIFSPYFGKAIWFQNSSLYHFSLFHASHHISPVPATKDQLEAEAEAVRNVAKAVCPLKIVLDRVVLTSTGVLLGCWQAMCGPDKAKVVQAFRRTNMFPFHNGAIIVVSQGFLRQQLLCSPGQGYVSGTDPLDLRAKLRSALPHAPQKQLYDPAILHTTFARLLGSPTKQPEDSEKYSDGIQFLRELVTRLNQKIRGSEAVVSELWYVEELDVLALALDGRMKVRRFPLGCAKP